MQNLVLLSQSERLCLKSAQISRTINADNVLIWRGFGQIVEHELTHAGLWLQVFMQLPCVIKVLQYNVIFSSPLKYPI